MEIDKKAVGMRIAAIRKEKGLTLEEFGKLIDGASKSVVSKWERGDTIPNNKRTKLIAEAGNTTVDNLLYGGIKNFVYNFTVNHYPELKFITQYDVSELIKELEEEKVSISEIEKIRSEVEKKIPVWKERFSNLYSKYLNFITENKSYKEQMYAHFEEGVGSIDPIIIDKIFEEGHTFSFDDKNRYSREIEGIYILLEMLINEETYITDTFAIRLDVDDFIEKIHNIDINHNYKKYHLEYVVNLKPFPNGHDRIDVLVNINHNKFSDELEKTHILLSFFPNFKKEWLKKYFKNSKVVAVRAGKLFYGHLDEDSIFHTTVNGNKKKIDFNINFSKYTIFPVFAIYY